MKTLQEYLIDRDGDPRAMVAALDVQADRVYLRLGQLGGHPAVTVQIVGNEALVIQPAGLAKGDSSAPEPEAAPAVNPSLTNLPPNAFTARAISADAPAAEEPAPSADDGGAAAAADGLSADPAATPADDGQSASSAPPDGNGDAPAGDGGDPAPVAINPDAYLKAELLEMARAEGIDSVDEDDTKAVIAAEINAKRGV